MDRGEEGHGQDEKNLKNKQSQSCKASHELFKVPQIDTVYCIYLNSVVSLRGKEHKRLCFLLSPDTVFFVVFDFMCYVSMNISHSARHHLIGSKSFIEIELGLCSFLNCTEKLYTCK